MNQLLEEALISFKSRLSAVSDGENVFSPLFTTDYHTGPGESETNLRLDWELDSESFKTSTNRKVMDMMFEQMKVDLLDLIENGDVNSNDPLLSAFDGANKRNAQPVLIDITNGVMRTEPVERHKRVDFTVYMRLYVKWGDESVLSDIPQVQQVGS